MQYICSIMVLSNNEFTLIIQKHCKVRDLNTLPCTYETECTYVYICLFPYIRCFEGINFFEFAIPWWSCPTNSVDSKALQKKWHIYTNVVVDTVVFILGHTLECSLVRKKLAIQSEWSTSCQTSCYCYSLFHQIIQNFEDFVDLNDRMESETC